MLKVQFERTGEPDVLEIVSAPVPEPGSGEVRVRVITAAINPFDVKMMRGILVQSGARAQLPASNGIDFAGVVDELGPGVDPAWLGKSVLGTAPPGTHAEYLVVSATRLAEKPTELDWVRAGALGTSGLTAVASVRAVALGPTDTVLVSAAAGGVGVLAVQLAKRTGARVIGSASEANHDFLRQLGIEPVPYGDGLVDAVRAIAPAGITAALDTHGRASVLAALELGAPPSRLNSIADYGAPKDFGALDAGAAEALPGDLAEIARLVADGEVELPIQAVFPMTEVRAAYERLITGHLRGKIVLTISSPPGD